MISAITTFLLALAACTEAYTFEPKKLNVKDSDGIATVKVTFPEQINGTDRVWLYMRETKLLRMSPCMLVFNASNWDTPQEVEVAVDPSLGDVTDAAKHIKMYSWAPDAPGLAPYHDTTFRLPVSVTASPVLECLSWGDPHFTTFKGLVYDFMGAGTFYHVLSDDGRFAVQSKHVVCRMRTDADGKKRHLTCNQQTTVKYNERVYTTQWKQEESMWTWTELTKNTEDNGVKVKKDKDLRESTLLLPSGASIKVSDGRDHQTIKTKLPGMYRNNVRGLCGPADDGAKESMPDFDGNVFEVSSRKIDAATVRNITAFASTFLVPEEQYLCTNLDAVLPLRKEMNLSPAYTTKCAVPPKDQLPQQTTPLVGCPNGRKPVDEAFTRPEPCTGDDCKSEYEAPEMEDEVQVNATTYTDEEYNAAKAACEAVLDDKTCNKLIDREAYLTSCITDMLEGMECTEGVKSTYKASCKLALEKAAYNGDTLTKDDYSGFQCYGNCGGNGKCVKGTGCVCDEGFSGKDCRIPVARMKEDPKSCYDKAIESKEMSEKVEGKVYVPESENLPQVEGTFLPDRDITETTSGATGLVPAAVGAMAVFSAIVVLV